MDTLQPLHRKMVYATATIAFVSFVISIYFVLFKGDFNDLTNAGFIFLLLAVGGLKTSAVYWRGQILYWSATGIIQIAALLLVGLWPTLLAVLCHSFVQDVVRTPKILLTKAWVVKALGGNALMTILSASVFYALGGNTHEMVLPEDLLALIAMILVFAICNNLFVFILGFAAIHPRPLAEFKSHFKKSPLYLTFTMLEGVIGTLAVFAYYHQPWLIVFLAIYPILLVWSFKQTADLQHKTDQALEGFANLVDQRNKNTVAHSKRVAEYALQIGKTMGLTSTELDRLHWTSRLHDLGAVAIDPSLLEKEGDLTDEEASIIRAHAAASSNILSAFAFSKAAAEIVYCHHERPDGTGYYNYPLDKIPLESFIIAVADAYDAMTSDRAYRVKLEPKDAYKELLDGRGTQFDKNVVEAFLYSQDPKLFPMYQDRLPKRPGDKDWAITKRSLLETKDIKFEI